MSIPWLLFPCTSHQYLYVHVILCRMLIQTFCFKELVRAIMGLVLTSVSRHRAHIQQKVRAATSHKDTLGCLFLPLLQHCRECSQHHFNSPSFSLISYQQKQLQRTTQKPGWWKRRERICRYPWKASLPGFLPAYSHPPCFLAKEHRPFDSH